MRYVPDVPMTKILTQVAPPNTVQQESLTLRGQRRPIRLWENATGQFIIVDGRRRVVDLLKLEKSTVAALVYGVDELDEENLHLDALTLNSGDPNFMDEADHVYYLITECDYTVEDVASAASLSESTVLNRLDLYHKLIVDYQKALRCGNIKVSAAYELVKLSKSEQQGLFDKQLLAVKKVRVAVKNIRNGRLLAQDVVTTTTSTAVSSAGENIPHSDEDLTAPKEPGPGIYFNHTELDGFIKKGGSFVYMGTTYKITLVSS